MFKRRPQSESRPAAPAPAKRVLVIGSTAHPRVRCARWDERNFPNVADHDAIVVNSMPLAQLIRAIPADESNEMCKRVRSNQNAARMGILKALGAGKPVYAIDAAMFYRKSEKHEGAFYFGGMSNREWMPLPVRQECEEGETLRVIDPAFNNYAGLVARWDHLYYVEQLEQHQWTWLPRQMFGRDLDSYVAIEQSPVAENCYNRLVSVKLRLAFHRIVHHEYGERSLQREPELRTGELVLLPEPTECSDRDAVNVLLEDFFGVPRATLPPEWTDALRIPGEEALLEKGTAFADELRRIQEDRKGLSVRLEELCWYKRLMYETGPALETVCRRVLQELGATVGDAEVAKEDIVLEFEGNKAIAEVKGNTGAVKLDDLRQLGHYKDDYRIKLGREVKGILLGNPWRLVPPSERRQAAFTPDACSYASDRSIALVTTVALYEALCRVRESKATGAEVLRKMFAGSGIASLL
jgi:hypothetical protein